MKKLFIVLIGVVVSSCSVTIPLQTNLSDQTMLLADNKNIKANYTLVSNVADGFITYVSVLKNGTESINNSSFKYGSETAFKKLWGSYFSNKFNEFAENQMDIKITLKELKLKQQAATSMGMTMLTGNSKVNVDAIAVVQVEVKYHGKRYKKQFTSTTSEYNESQQMSSGNYYFSVNQTNPTQQKSKLLEGCLNRSIIQFENFFQSVIFRDEEG